MSVECISCWEQSSEYWYSRGSRPVEPHRTHCLDQRDQPDPTIDIVENVGGTYVDLRRVSLDEVLKVYEPIDYTF